MAILVSLNVSQVLAQFAARQASVARVAKAHEQGGHMKIPVHCFAHAVCGLWSLTHAFVHVTSLTLWHTYIGTILYGEWFSGYMYI